MKSHRVCILRWPSYPSSFLLCSQGTPKVHFGYMWINMRRMFIYVMYSYSVGFHSHNWDLYYLVTWEIFRGRVLCCSGHVRRLLSPCRLPGKMQFWQFRLNTTMIYVSVQVFSFRIQKSLMMLELLYLFYSWKAQRVYPACSKKWQTSLEKLHEAVPVPGSSTWSCTIVALACTYSHAVMFVKMFDSTFVKSDPSHSFPT